MATVDAHTYIRRTFLTLMRGIAFCSGQVRHAKGGVVLAAANGAGWLLADERPQLGEAQQSAIRGGLQPPDGRRCD